jgi:hypothetical protein
MPLFSPNPRTVAILKVLVNQRCQYGNCSWRGLEVEVDGFGRKVSQIRIKIFGQINRATVYLSNELQQEGGSYETEGIMTEDDILEVLAAFLRWSTGKQKEWRQKLFSSRSTIGKRARHLAECEIRLEFLKRKGWGECFEASQLMSKIAEHVDIIGCILARSMRIGDYDPMDKVWAPEVHAGGVVLRLPPRADPMEIAAVIEAALPEAARTQSVPIVASFRRWS